MLPGVLTQPLLPCAKPCLNTSQTPTLTALPGHTGKGFTARAWPGKKLMVNAGPENKSPVSPPSLSSSQGREEVEEGARWWQEMLCGVWPGAAARERAASDPGALQSTNLEEPVPNRAPSAVTPNTEGSAALSCWTEHPPSSLPKPRWSRALVTDAHVPSL